MTDKKRKENPTASGDRVALTSEEETLKCDANLKRTIDDADLSQDESKRPKIEDAPLDLALTLGFKAGDRIQVQWEIEKKGETTVHWWGATLLKHDGRTTDTVAVRTIQYDAYPELGFETCTDDVIFLGDDLIVSPDSQTQLKFRREGGKEEDQIFLYNEEDMDTQLNDILMRALDKNKNAWTSLNPAQQAIIAEKIAQKKDKLMGVLRSQNDVITSAAIRDILQQAFE